ncbi:MAG: pyrroloquinoline quinone biosynthesis protein PqqB [Hyphomicrobiaceae bacterium]
MKIKVLGSAAGGGLPQWNCNGRNSRDARAGVEGLRARTQSSLAVSPDGRDWTLLNASPDLRQQINDNVELHPNADGGPRNSPIKSVVLTNGDVDHVAGLLNLREGQTFRLFASERVIATLNSNSIFNVLNPAVVERVPIVLNRPFAVDEHDGLVVEAFAVPGKVALYLEDEASGPNFGTREGDTIGLKVSTSDRGRSFFYIPACAEIDAKLAARLTGAALVFFDGTLFTDDEMIDQRLSTKTGARMGHMNMSGAQGSMRAFESLNVQRRIFIHINNSNPVLREGSEAHATVMAAGWEVAHDGMEVTL